MQQLSSHDGCYDAFCDECNGSGYDYFDDQCCQACGGAGDVKICSRGRSG